MITESDAYQRRGSTRLLCSLLASAMVNIFAWTGIALSTHTLPYATTKRQQSRETLIVSSSTVHIERRIVRRRQSPASAPPAERVAPVLPVTPSLYLPRSWTKQDTGNEGMLNVALWLDWTKQTAEFVPRVFLWQRQLTDPDGRRASLKDAVQDILTTLHAEGDKLYASNPQRVCDGTQPGWFLSYDKPEDDPPVHIDDTLFVAGDTVFRATYVRPVGQPEDPKTRDALNSLCAQS